MCGISAIAGDLRAREAGALLRAMHAPIRHRGPDGEGFLLVDDELRATAAPTLDTLSGEGRARAGFAFRRLKIVDLSDAAMQPIRTARGAAWLVFNGEIYNYRELRRELIALGHAFRSEGDAEVALAAYEEWGTECFPRFQGMWAMVIADIARRQLVASRDRLGIKPLLWSIHGNALLLASEAKQIIAATGRAEANVALVAAYLRGSRLPVYEETFFRGIRSVPPATWFSMPLDGAVHEPTFIQYWDLRRFVASPSYSYDAAREELRALLEATVDSHRHADVATGSLLSGGLDSSVLAAMMARRVAAEGKRVSTFSFGFREKAPAHCEMPYVDAVLAAEPAMVNYETTFDAAWLARHAGDVIRAVEEPPLASAAMAQYRVFQLVRERDTTVVLDGEGSDEIFAGYPPYHRLLLMDRLRRGEIATASRELSAMARRYRRSRVGLLSSFVVPPIARRLKRSGYSWLDAAAIAPERFPEDAVDRSHDPSLVNRALFQAVRWGNVKLVLGYTDRVSMVHSVEARVPYMDHRVVELAFSLPDSFKAGGGERKRILRDVGRELLPPLVTERSDRMGFMTPEDEMLRNGLRKPVDDAIRDAGIASLGFIDRRGLEKHVRDFHLGRHRDGRSLWRLFAFAEWKRQFAVTGL
jgi:asparagine synthase (glutamine-hydrolysing)